MSRRYTAAVPPRFHVPELSGPTEVISLPRDEGRHLVRVLRLGEGAEIAVFDGRGREYRAHVTSVDGDLVRVQPGSRLEPAAEPVVTVSVAHALLKGRKLDDVLRDLTMVGVSTFQPLETERVEARPRDVSRWTRVAVASAKQCGRAVVPTIAPSLDLASYLEGADDDVRLMLVEPRAADDAADTLSRLSGEPPPARATLMVGPEGGWSPDEIVRARDVGFRPLTLGRRTWRADAAALCAIGVLQYVWRDL